VAEIDRLNILRASHLAMQRAVAALPIRPELLLVDGNLLPVFAVPAVAVVAGDLRVPAISAASIVAKVARDAEMKKLARKYPGYGFERHMGYATAEHRLALTELGPTPAHRRSFAPVRERLATPAGGQALFAE
jgi:ribonuclease HII